MMSKVGRYIFLAEIKDDCKTKYMGIELIAGNLRHLFHFRLHFIDYI